MSAQRASVAAVGPAVAVVAPRPRARWATLRRALRRDKGGAVGLLLVTLWLTTALLGPLVVSDDPNAQDLAVGLLPPVWEAGGQLAYPLGTDQLGRDLLTRIVSGARTSLVVGVAAVGLAALVGSVAGAVAAEWRGRVDELIMRLADTQLAIPFILLAITVLALLGGSLVNMVLVLVLASWVIYARVIRGELLVLRELEFVQAARALGASRVRIAMRHLLPNTLGLVIVIGTLELANVIVLEAALSFLGVGIRPPEVSWGAMLADGRDYLTTAWWVATLPGLAITLAILGINLLGDWTRDLLDPRHRRD